MRKIDLSEYDVIADDGKVIHYNVKKSLELVLYHPELRLNYISLMENHKIAQRVITSESSILLEESDYDKVATAIQGITGYTKMDVEFVRRVLEAEKIEVVEKEK